VRIFVENPEEPSGAPELLLTGYIEQDNYSDGKSQTRSLSGRSVTADLIDSAFTDQSGQFRNMSATKIIERLCHPFGIEVEADDDGVIVPDFQPEIGQTVMEVIHVLSKMSRKQAGDTPQGKLRVSAQAAQNVGKVSKDIEALSVNVDHSRRYQQYIVQSQAKSTSEKQGAAAAQIIGRAIDDRVDRPRILHIYGKGVSDNKSARTLALYHAQRAFGQSISVNTTLTGWRTPGGNLWRKGTLVFIEHPKVNQSLMVANVSLRLSRTTGTTTQLTLQPIQAFLDEPVFQEKSRDSAKKTGINGSNPSALVNARYTKGAWETVFRSDSKVDSRANRGTRNVSSD